MCRVKPPSQVNAQQDEYAGQTIRVQGKIFLQKTFSQSPCPALSNGPCNTFQAATVQIVDRDRQSGNLTVYIESKGDFQPVTCTESSDITECEGYTDGQDVTLEGTYIKHRIPYGSTSIGGKQVVFSWQDIYIFVVPPVSEVPVYPTLTPTPSQDNFVQEPTRPSYSCSIDSDCDICQRCNNGQCNDYNTTLQQR